MYQLIIFYLTRQESIFQSKIPVKFPHNYYTDEKETKIVNILKHYNNIMDIILTLTNKFNKLDLQIKLFFGDYLNFLSHLLLK